MTTLRPHLHRRPLALVLVLAVAAAVLALLASPRPAAADTFSGRVEVGGTAWRAHDLALTAGQTLTATLDWDAGTADLNLFLRDPAGANVASATSTTARPESVTYAVPTSGTYRLAAKAVTGGAAYSIVTSTTETPPDPGGFTGTVDAGGTRYRTHAQSFPSAGTLRASLDWASAGADLNLFLRTGTTVLKSATAKTSKPEVVTWTVDGPADLNWGVKAVTGATTYRLTVSFTPSGGGGGDRPTEWPRFMYDAWHTGVSPDTALSAADVAGLEPLWQDHTGDRVYASPVVAWDASREHNVVYVSNQVGVLSAYHASTGERLYTSLLDGPVNGPATVDNGTVYVGTTDYSLYALDQATGAVRCRYDAGGVVNTAPVVVDLAGRGRVVYLGDSGITGGDDGGALHAIDAVDPNARADCGLVWKYDAWGEPAGSRSETGVWSTPVFSKDVNGRELVVFGSSSIDNSVYALDARTGQRVWRYLTTTSFPDHDVGAAPLVTPPGHNGMADGVVYVPNKNSIMYALNLRTGAKLWEFAMKADTPGLRGAARSTPALIGRTIYFGFGQGVYALDAVTGQKRWKTAPTGEVISSPAVAGPAGQQVLLVGSLDGSVYAFRASDGATLWSYKTGSFVYPSVAVADGKVYIASDDSFLYAFGLDPQAAARPDTTLTTPAAGSTVTNPGTGGSVAVSGTATGSAGVQRVRVAIKNRNNGQWWDAERRVWTKVFTQSDAALATAGGTSTGWSTSFPAPRDGGQFFVQAEAVDASGRRDPSVAQTTFTVGSAGAPPETTITDPAFAQVFHFPNGRESFPITISGTAADSGGANPGIARVVVTVVNIEHGERFCGAPGCGGGTTEPGVSQWTPGFATVDAALSDPGAASTAWSLTFPVYDHQHKYRLSAYAVDADGEKDTTPFVVQRICVRDVGNNACS